MDHYYLYEATHAPFNYTFYIYMFLEKKKEKRMKVAVLQVYGISHFPPSILFIKYFCEGN